MGVLAKNLQRAAIHEVDSADADQARAVRVAELQDMLSARDGKPGFRRNVQAIRGEIARLQQEA